MTWQEKLADKARDALAASKGGPTVVKLRIPEFGWPKSLLGKVNSKSIGPIPKGGALCVDKEPLRGDSADTWFLVSATPFRNDVFAETDYFQYANLLHEECA